MSERDTLVGGDSTVKEAKTNVRASWQGCNLVVVDVILSLVILELDVRKDVPTLKNGCGGFSDRCPGADVILNRAKEEIK